MNKIITVENVEEILEIFKINNTTPTIELFEKYYAAKAWSGMSTKELLMAIFPAILYLHLSEDDPNLSPGIVEGHCLVAKDDFVDNTWEEVLLDWEHAFNIWKIMTEDL